MERVEEEVVKVMEQWMNQYKLTLKQKEKPVTDDLDRKLLQSLQKELQELHRQKNGLHDFLERGVYSIDVYLERSTQLAERIALQEKRIEDLSKDIERKEIERKTRRDYIPALINVMKLYHKANIEQKNKLLKSVLHKVVYTKNNLDKLGFFELVLYPKLPGDEDI